MRCYTGMHVFVTKLPLWCIWPLQWRKSLVTEALISTSMRFWLATLGFFEWLGKSPPKELMLSWEVLVLFLLITSAKVRSSSVTSSFSPLTGSIMGREVLGTRNVEGIMWSGHWRSGIRGILLYTFTSSCSKISRSVSTKSEQRIPEVLDRSIRLLTPICLGGFFTEYKLGTYGTISAPMRARLTRSKVSFFSMCSTENWDGSETPRYSKPNHAHFSNGRIRRPTHEYITDAPVTPASLCFFIMPSRSSI
jgi:hypothetical protein